MAITTMKEFIFKNGLKQIEVAKYLEISKERVSRYTIGTLNTPDWIVDKLQENPYGWDTTMFTNVHDMAIVAEAKGNGKSLLQLGNNNNGSIDAPNVNTAALQKEIEMLRQQLAEEKKRSDEYWKMIQTLMSK